MEDIFFFHMVAPALDRERFVIDLAENLLHTNSPLVQTITRKNAHFKDADKSRKQCTRLATPLSRAACWGIPQSPFDA